MKKLLIGATIALSVLLPLGVAYAAPSNKPDPNPNNGQDCEENGNNGGNNAPHCTTTTVTGPPTTTTQSPGQGDPNPNNGQDCEENGNNGGNNAPHCTTTTVTGPPTTTTQPPGDPCDEDEIVDQDNCQTTTTQPPNPCDDEIVDLDNCQTTTTQPPNPCDDEIVDQDNCPTTTTTLPVPLPTTTAPPTTTVAPACPGRVRLGNWYADPQINIFLRGKGTFKVTGGIQRFSGQRTIVATLGCGEKLKVPHYKVKSGHALKVYKDGKLVINQVPPPLN
jgi:hypothetical protein